MYATSYNEINAELRALADAMRRGYRTQASRTPPKVEFAEVEAAFQRAKAAGVAFPVLRLGEFEFKPAGENSRNAGGIYVYTLKVMGVLPGTYLGKVIGGQFLKSRDCTDKQQAEIVVIAKDPKAAAVAFGKRFGRCSVCNRTLTDPDSIANAIGPICARKFGF